MKNEELQERLITFAVSTFELCSSIRQVELGKILTNQLIRSATSIALNYGEAQGAESKKNFVHKLRIALKELRESHVSLIIIEKAKLSNSDEKMQFALNECNQLIAIFVSSIRTVENNSIKKM